MVLSKTNIALAILVLVLSSCKHSPQNIKPDDFPEEIGKIFLTKCATSGCHNQSSYPNAAGFNLSSWDNLFNGAVSGSPVIPYRPDFSSLCYFINTDTSLGITLTPTMPLNLPPLSRDEYITIATWIASGAPSADGRIKFSDNPDRQKIYVTNRQCDVVTVVDVETLLPMRYIEVGTKPAIEYPVCIKVAPDKKNWYVSFYSESNIIQKFNATNDKLIGNIDLGTGIWTSFYISSDSRYGYFVDNSNPGKVACADLEKMRVVFTLNNAGDFRYPSGIVVNQQLQKIYVGSAYGNFIYSIDITDTVASAITEITLDGSNTPLYHSLQNPTELIAGNDNSLCYIACEGSGEVKIMDMKAEKVISTISLGAKPSFMTITSTTQRLFVTCPDDTLSFPNNKGSVKIIDLNTKKVIKTLNSGYQPYGIALISSKNLVAIANANISLKGPSSHHRSRCGTKNGNVSFIDLNTLSVIPNKKIEVSVYPFGVAAR